MGVLHHTPDTPGAVAEIYRVLKPHGHLIVMLYHRDSALYRWTLRFRSWTTRRPREELVNEVDGVGNPKGEVYSKDEMRALLGRFDRPELSVGVLNGWMVLPRGGRFLPRRLLERMAPRWGWFLYAKARKPA
jgi:SAM-dependent methyltransferase